MRNVKSSPALKGYITPTPDLEKARHNFQEDGTEKCSRASV